MDHNSFYSQECPNGQEYPNSQVASRSRGHLRHGGIPTDILARAMGVHSPELLSRAEDGSETPAGPILVFDGGCIFCRHFAELSELRSGIPGLVIRDGRSDTELRRSLARQGFQLRDGAMVIEGERVWHGAEAITWLCARMTPSAALLRVLSPLMADGERARRLYPLLLLARRVTLGLRGLPVDPETSA